MGWLTSINLIQDKLFWDSNKYTRPMYCLQPRLEHNWVRCCIIEVCNYTVSKEDLKNHVTLVNLWNYFVSGKKSWQGSSIFLGPYPEGLSLDKKWSFPVRISSVLSGFGHIYWRNLWWKTSFFVDCFFRQIRIADFESLTKLISEAYSEHSKKSKMSVLWKQAFSC